MFISTFSPIIYLVPNFLIVVYSTDLDSSCIPPPNLIGCLYKWSGIVCIQHAPRIANPAVKRFLREQTRASLRRTRGTHQIEAPPRRSIFTTPPRHFEGSLLLSLREGLPTYTSLIPLKARSCCTISVQACKGGEFDAHQRYRRHGDQEHEN